MNRLGRMVAWAGIASVAFASVTPGEPNAATDQPAENAAPKMEFKREWCFRAPEQQYQLIERSLNKPAPKLSIANWVGEAQDLAKLKGQIVVIDFWATWCRPCIGAIPHTNEIAESYKDKGVKVFGVCNTRGSGTMQDVVRSTGMKYPTGADSGDQSATAYQVQWWPYYVVIDRKGDVRAAGIRSDTLDDALDALLAEQPAPAGEKGQKQASTDGANPAEKVDVAAGQSSPSAPTSPANATPPAKDTSKKDSPAPGKPRVYDLNKHKAAPDPSAPTAKPTETDKDAAPNP
ncbi:MAG TPA: redoxin domain-containing protein, partial [Phycisphaerales bacterium]|nr:redoxin domain-containing protein [Phycisphaerales bacterium]